jgi:N-acetylglucosamine-6-phosphate deacetylase
MTGRFQFLGPEGLGTYELDGSPRRIEGSSDRLLVPGFVDIHIHGAFGIDFMSASGPADVVRMAERLEEVGYEAFLPTTVTDSLDSIKAALRNLPDHRTVAGFHLEGPFLSPVFPGAQPKQWIVDPPQGSSEWDEVLDHPKLRIVTLAPERPGALDLARRLYRRGVIVSLGHTNGTFEECRLAEEAGVKHATHTFNAMRSLHHREAGTAGYALSSDPLSCELIYDRHHVSPEAAALLVKNKPADKLIAISDATMAAGLPGGSTVEMWGLTGHVSQGTVRLPDGTLAGSSITLLDAFRNLAADFGLETAIRACCINPRIDLGLTEPRVYIELNRNLEIVGRHEA